MGKSGRLLFVCLAWSLAFGCAVTEEANRRTLNALDRHLAPPTAVGRWAAAPVALPLSLASLAADALVVHPLTVFDDAWRDTDEWLWTPNPSESRFRRAVLFPLTVMATPVIYVGDWMARAVFAIDPHDAPPAHEVERGRKGSR
jgi:hypothetical protein